MGSEHTRNRMTQARVTKVHDIVKVCLSMASGMLESHLKGNDIVKVCLSMASATLESHLEGHAIGKACLVMASKTLETRFEGRDICLCLCRLGRHRDLTLTAILLYRYACPWLARSWTPTLRATICKSMPVHG